jgi:ubiquinone biosynthesis protein UbiJ
MRPLPELVLAFVNHLLDQSAWARLKLQPFVAQHAKISLPPFSLVFTVTTEGLLTQAAADVQPAVLIDLPANTPFLLWQGQTAIMRTARISGSADFAQSLGYVLQHLRWDIEEDLSRFFGDIVANRMKASAHVFAVKQKNLLNNLAENLSEYLVEERSVLVHRIASADFTMAVNRLPGNISHLEERLQRLG